MLITHGEDIGSLFISRRERGHTNAKMQALQPPPSLQLTGNVAENWRRFIQRFMLHLTAIGADEKSAKMKASVFFHVKKRWSYIITFSSKVTRTKWNWIKYLRSLRITASLKET